MDYERTAPTRRDVPTLAPIHDALRALGDPHHDVPCVHVTGTNGKGSTTAITAALLEATGRRVGTYTSPDLHAVNERIGVAGAPIDDEALASVLGRLRGVEEALGITLTRFELLTVAALLHFADEAVDVAVIEVGLGGTWDATNVVDASVAVVTNVSLDHTEVLGDTVEAIARDKAGIVKPGSLAILGDASPLTVELQADLAGSHGARAIWRRGHELELTGNDLALGGRLVSLVTPLSSYDDVFLSLHGRHQGANALCALAAAEGFGGTALGEELVAAAFGAVTVPGRLEIMSRRPMVLLDSAHNPAGAEVLADALIGTFAVEGVVRCVVGTLSNREPESLLAPLVRAGVEVAYCCEPTDAARAAGGLDRGRRAAARHGGARAARPRRRPRRGAR